MTNEPKKEWAEPTDDGMPIKTMRHPRNTVLGASLELERMLPDMPIQEINRVSILLAQAFQEEFASRTEALIAGLEGMKKKEPYTFDDDMKHVLDEAIALIRGNRPDQIT